MEYFYYFELFSIIILFIVALKEFELLYSFSNKFMPKSLEDNNFELIDSSIKIIFEKKFGELYVFLYPITFLLISGTTYLYLDLNSITNEYYVYNFIVISSFVIAAHVVIPYYFNYLKYYEESVRKKLDLKTWLKVRLMNLGREELNIVAHELSEDLVLNYRVFNFTAETFREYNSYVYKFKLNLFEYEYLEYNDYIKILPFLTGHNFFVKDSSGEFIEYMLNESTVSLNSISFGVDKMYYSIFSKVRLDLVFLSRYIEIVMFFIIINTLLVLTNQL